MQIHTPKCTKGVGKVKVEVKIRFSQMLIFTTKQLTLVLILSAL